MAKCKVCKKEKFSFGMKKDYSEFYTQKVKESDISLFDLRSIKK